MSSSDCRSLDDELHELPAILSSSLSDIIDACWLGSGLSRSSLNNPKDNQSNMAKILLMMRLKTSLVRLSFMAALFLCVGPFKYSLINWRILMTNEINTGNVGIRMNKLLIVRKMLSFSVGSLGKSL